MKGQKKMIRLLKRWIFRLRLLILKPERVDYIFGPSTLPPPLSKEEEEQIMEQLKGGDESVRDLLIVHNLRLVVYIAKKIRYSRSRN